MNPFEPASSPQDDRQPGLISLLVEKRLSAAQFDGQQKKMAIVVVGGQSREVGKTSVVAGLISSLPQYNWTAFKITQFGHGRCSLDGKPCSCATDDRCWAINEEKELRGFSDTSRFLAAGAKRSYWVRTEQGRLAEALPTMRRRIAESENAIFESNSILDFIQPNLYITLLDSSVDDFKASAKRLLDRADAIILPRGMPTVFERAGRAPVFEIEPPQYVTEEIVEFLRNVLEREPYTSAVRPRS